MLHLRIVREGKDKGQGVGYLPDGTMVVVNNGQSSIGQQVEVQVQSLLQTGAGVIVFAELKAPVRPSARLVRRCLEISASESLCSMQFVTVFTAFNPAEAELVRSRLEAAEFHPVITHGLSALSIDGYALAAGGILVRCRKMKPRMPGNFSQLRR